MYKEKAQLQLSIFGYNLLFRLSGASTEPNRCVYHKSRAATAPTSGGIFTEMQLRVFLLLRSQRSLASVQLLVTAVFFSDTFLLAFVFVFSLPQPSLVF